MLRLVSWTWYSLFTNVILFLFAHSHQIFLQERHLVSVIFMKLVDFPLFVFATFAGLFLEEVPAGQVLHVLKLVIEVKIFFS